MISEIEPGTIIRNRYQIQKLLGKGQFGRTYLAFDTERFDEACVLKEFVPTISEEKSLHKSRELFECEAKVLYQIQHPQIPKFLAWFTDNQRIFIVQEYIQGKTYFNILCDRIVEKGQPFSEIEVRTWLMDILPVLEYLHERKIIHRDISLDNIMFADKQSKPVLIDFGAVQENFTEIPSSDSLNFYNSIRSSVVGRFGYSPPEQLRLGRSYPSSDIYALGVCAVILLTGKMPNLLVNESLNWQWHSQANVSNDFAKILEKMLAEELNKRFQSAQEVLIALNQLQDNSPALPHSKLKITSPVELIKNRKKERENKKALEELLTLQDLEIKLRQSYDNNDSLQPQKPIYLGLDISEYMEHELAEPNKSSNHGLIKISALAKKINDFLTGGNIKQAELNRNKNNHFLQRNPQEFLETYTVTSNLQLLEIIKEELTNFIGPMANVIIKEVLVIFPHCSFKELIEILAADIPDKQTAKQFQEYIYNLIKSKADLLPKSN
jgi:serine/threonine protein kinase